MKNILVLLFTAMSLVIFSSCEKDQIETQAKMESFKVDFDKFSVGVENNTLVFNSEVDLQECIDYLVEIGEENYDKFEKSLGYTSFRKTGKKLETCNDPLMKTLINPNMENVICGFLTVSDFTNETAVAYRLDETVQCNLAELKRDELESFNFTFDDDFFVFIENGSLKSVTTDYCDENTESGNWEYECPYGADYDDPDDIKIKFSIKTIYNRSLFYKYLQLYIVCEQGGAAEAAIFEYYTSGDCFWQNTVKNSRFERSESVSFPRGGDSSTSRIGIFDRKPYSSTRRLTNYIFNIVGELYVNDPDAQPGEPFMPLRKTGPLDHKCE